MTFVSGMGAALIVILNVKVNPNQQTLASGLSPFRIPQSLVSMAVVRTRSVLP